MKIRFLGGAGEVGRSSFLLEMKRKIMLDCGVKINNKSEYPIESKADVILISHAHLDHVGFTPFYERFAGTPVIGTHPTLWLSELLLRDFIKVNKRKHEKIPFKNQDIERFKHNFTYVNYDEEFVFGNEIKFFNAGHIPGSSMIEIDDDGRKILYTGDFKTEETYLQEAAQVHKADVLITESTYANRNHPPRREVEEKLKEEIEETISKGGTVLLPTFAVGRAQEMLLVLENLNFTDITYLDGMAKDATQIILNFKNSVANWNKLNKVVQKVNFIEERRDRFEALKSPAVILTTAGMLNGGPVLDYITRINKNSKIIFTGYQVEGTNGRQLLETGTITINGKKFQVPQKALYLDFSAHAGRDELFKFISKAEPEKIIVIHGDSKISVDFKDELLMLGYDAIAPKNNSVIEI